MSELEGVKQEIAEVKRDLEEAKKNGFPIDNVGVVALNLLVALNNRLTELQKKENLLLSSRQRRSFVLLYYSYFLSFLLRTGGFEWIKSKFDGYFDLVCAVAMVE